MAFVDPTGEYCIETGGVEEGDTWESIEEELEKFYEIDISRIDLQIINKTGELEVGGIIRMGTRGIHDNTWQPTNPDTVTEEYFKSLTEEQRIIQHKHRLLYQKNNDDIKDKNKKLNEEEWDINKNAIAHNLKGAKGNDDYRGKGSKSNLQAIYDKDGNLVTTPENIGTYDYIIPGFGPGKSFKGHWEVDVKPWIKYGNGAGDTTSRQERVNALKKIKAGRLGGLLWGF